VVEAGGCWRGRGRSPRLMRGVGSLVAGVGCLPSCMVAGFGFSG